LILTNAFPGFADRTEEPVDILEIVEDVHRNADQSVPASVFMASSPEA